MAELLKDNYNLEFVQLLCQHLISLSPKAKQTSKTQDLSALFIQSDWNELELKQRMNRAGLTSLEIIENDDFTTSCEIIKQLSDKFDAFLGMFIPQMITDLFFKMQKSKQNNNLNVAFEALKHVTKNSTSEFAIRPFIENFETQTMQFMLSCAENENEHVRRLASEGSRSRLPWGQALKAFKKDPTAIWPILNKLKQDESLYVRRSVANNLNDISKDNPKLMLDWCEKHNKKSDKEDWIIKHACRVLLKQAHPRALQLFDYSDASKIIVDHFKIHNPTVKIGEKLEFECTIKHEDKHTIPLGKLRIEYCIDYLKANGKHNQKVFNWSEKQIESAEITLKSTQSMAQMSTRKHYVGKHFICIRINGREFDKHEFVIV